MYWGILHRQNQTVCIITHPVSQIIIVVGIGLSRDYIIIHKGVDAGVLCYQRQIMNREVGDICTKSITDLVPAFFGIKNGTQPDFIDKQVAI